MDVGEAHFAGASPGKMGWADQPTREFSKPTIAENYTPTDRRTWISIRSLSISAIFKPTVSDARSPAA